MVREMMLQIEMIMTVGLGQKKLSVWGRWCAWCQIVQCQIAQCQIVRGVKLS